MSASNDGGPAFPQPDTYHESGQIEYGSPGMTLRDYFAGCELKKIAGAHLNDKSGAYDNLAKHCYRMADAMLAARKVEAEGGAA